jgi:C-terminal processing protease CtpA/Prc
MIRASFWLALSTSFASCASDALPRTPPPLAGMEEPLEWMDEPADEEQRRALPSGSFTGVVVGDARTSLDEMLSAPSGLAVTRVVENSPAAIAGIAEGDLLLEVRTGKETVALAWPAEWRRIELEAEPGSVLRVLVDRAGAEKELELTTVQRISAGPRAAATRYTEGERVGLVVRTATEVEARSAALGPGGGAVVVGLTRESPWRGAGVVYGDLIRAVNGVEVAHPQVLLDQLRSAPADSEVELELLRAGAMLSVKAPLTHRESELKSFNVPLIYSFERERDLTERSLLLGLVRWRRTPAAWDFRLLWFITLRGGDSNRLESL